MVIGLWHPGSGLGDQLFCYLAARITAERLGVDFTMVGEFKGDSFLTLDKGVSLTIPHHIEYPAGKIVIENDWALYEGKTYYDPEFNFIADHTIVDGCRIQDERYFEGCPWQDWLVSDYVKITDDTCVINFRGGEFAAIPELFLPQSYWDEAIERQRDNGFNIFEVHTDDPVTAEKFFPNFKITHDVGVNWRSVRSARGAIIANSAFGIIPRLLNGGITIAPRRWSRPYEKDWSFAPQNYYKDFIYL